jgi:hypothetical protein
MSRDYAFRCRTYEITYDVLSIGAYSMCAGMHWLLAVTQGLP